MIGHGGPNPSQGRFLPAVSTTAAAALCRSALVLLVVLTSRALMADDLRVRIAWGGGSDREWQGTIGVSEGSISEPRPLGIEADEPGSMWLDGNSDASRRLVIRQRSPRGYDGVDLLVAAPAGAKLLVRLSGVDDSGQAATIEAPLADLSGEFVNKELDNCGNRLLVMRTPGDSLRVSLPRDGLVFAPGETFRCTLEPHALPLAEGSRARIKVQLLGGGKELWSQQHDVQAAREAKIPLEVRLPDEEGVYDLAIAATANPTGRRPSANP